jgi:hypothetical protein
MQKGRLLTIGLLLLKSMKIQLYSQRQISHKNGNGSIANRWSVTLRPHSSVAVGITVSPKQWTQIRQVLEDQLSLAEPAETASENGSKLTENRAFSGQNGAFLSQLIHRSANGPAPKQP